jgi:hypothetical protein
VYSVERELASSLHRGGDNHGGLHDYAGQEQMKHRRHEPFSFVWVIHRESSILILQFYMACGKVQLLIFISFTFLIGEIIAAWHSADFFLYQRGGA